MKVVNKKRKNIAIFVDESAASTHEDGQVSYAKERGRLSREGGRSI